MIELLSLLVIGLLEIGLAIPLILRRVPPNWIYGFRTTTTLSNKEIWYKANTFAGKLLLGAGIVALILAYILWLLRETLSLVLIQVVSVAGIVVPLSVVLLASLLYLRRLPYR